ncbi:sugar transferase [Candidatus Fermentibacterales bacterium]|nr:sugar transferase [Candidatus Fermentibacterales bacterium]
MPQRSRALTPLMALGDVVLVVGVFLLGYWVRHYLLADFLHSTMGLEQDFRLGLTQYLVTGTIMGLTEVLLLQAFGVYGQSYGLAHIEELAWILRSSFMAMVMTFAFTFLARQHFFSRSVLITAFPAAAVAVATWHRLCRSLARRRARSRGQATRAVIYGSGDVAAEVAAHLESRASRPYELVGFIQPSRSSETARVEALDAPGDLPGWLAANSIEELIVTDATLSREELSAVIYACEQGGVAYKLVADVFALISLTARVTQVGSTTMVESIPPPIRGFRALLKRGLDLAISMLLLILLSPVFLLISAAIVLDSGMPVFYVQTRLGRHNREFRMLKFRSMRKGADRERAGLSELNEASGPLFKMRSDPRVTRIGGLLRRWSLDELPQLFNVLSGSMSLVGPRPPLPSEVEHYKRRHLKRLETTPGMTGVWQISGRSELSFDRMIKLDIYYVDNWSVWLDLSIIMLTLPAILRRQGAY